MLAADSYSLLDALGDGIAITDLSGRVVWANAVLRSWADTDPVGQRLADALASDPLPELRSGPLRLSCRGERTLDGRIAALADGQSLVHLRDVSGEERKQRTLAALHHAGRALADLPADQLAELPAEERTELLKENIRQIAHDLLHYDLIEVRLLDPKTRRLTPLLDDGMVPEAAGRTLVASETGNGVTGLVAATGRSYLCVDTAADPHYLTGAEGARSSLTVPLLYADAVVGTLNVESPRANAFTDEDLQFTESLGREIGHALHTLELISAQGSTSSAGAVESIRRDVALPADDILAAATALLKRPPDEADVARLQRIVAGVRAIKRAIQSAALDDRPPEPLRGQRVLVVDADERMRRAAHGLLGRLGADVDAAPTGTEAVAMAGQGDYSAILTDIALPDMSGYEAYRQLRAACPEAKVVLMTAFGYDASHSIVKARQDGCRSVLFKPFRTDQVIDALAGGGC